MIDSVDLDGRKVGAGMEDGRKMGDERRLKGEGGKRR